MKFEDKINDVVEKLDENIPAPQTMGVPQAQNPAGVNPTGQAPTGAQSPAGEITAEGMLDWMGRQDPKVVAEYEKLQGDEKYQAIASAMQAEQGNVPNSQTNPNAPSNGTQTTSAAPASTNTSGTMGAGSVQV